MSEHEERNILSIFQKAVDELTRDDDRVENNNDCLLTTLLVGVRGGRGISNERMHAHCSVVGCCANYYYTKKMMM